MNKQDTRSAKKRAKDAAYAKLPAAIVCRPLRFILEHTSLKVTDPETKQERWEPGPAGIHARRLANRGDGRAVQAMAQRLALIA